MTLPVENPQVLGVTLLHVKSYKLVCAQALHDFRLLRDLAIFELDGEVKWSLG